MSTDHQHTWADIRSMVKARVVELFDAFAIVGALAGVTLLAISMTGVGFLLGTDIALSAIAFAVIPNALAQAVHRLYDD